MDYERQRRERWWSAFFIVYAAGVAYLLLQSNPHLYSNKELKKELIGNQKETLKPIPLAENIKLTTEKNLQQSFWWRESAGRSGAENNGGTHDKEYLIEVKVNLPIAHHPMPVSSDEAGFYFVEKGPWITATNNDGQIIWRYRFLGEDTQAHPPVISDAFVFATASNGTLIRLDKKTGELHWWMKVGESLHSASALVNGKLVLMGKPLKGEEEKLAKETTKRRGQKATPQTDRVIVVDAALGTVLDYSVPISFKGEAYLSANESSGQIFVTNDNRLHALDLAKGGGVAWSQTLPDPIVGPAMIYDGRLFLSLISGKIQAWDPAKKGGKFEWEVDIGKAPAGPPVFIPTFDRLAIATTDGHLHVVDVKKAEGLWNIHLDNRGSSQEVLAARISGRFIEEHGLKWENKGWTLWVPCSNGRICIYNPDKGQLISRIPLVPGARLFDRLSFKDGALYALLRQPAEKNDSVEGEESLILARLLDPKTLKRKKEEAAQTPPPAAKSSTSPAHQPES